jgi:hypothetical protein
MIEARFAPGSFVSKDDKYLIVFQGDVKGANTTERLRIDSNECFDTWEII